MKRLSAFLIVLTLLITCFSLYSCGKKDSGYTVLVTDNDGTPIENAYVQLCVGEKCLVPQKTNNLGKITFDVEDADYKVTVNPPQGYKPEKEEYKFPPNEKFLTIILLEDTETK